MKEVEGRIERKPMYFIAIIIVVSTVTLRLSRIRHYVAWMIARKWDSLTKDGVCKT